MSDLVAPWGEPVTFRAPGCATGQVLASPPGGGLCYECGVVPHPQPLLVALAATALTACAALPAVAAQDVAFLVPLDQARAFLPASEVLPRAVFDRLDHPLTVVDEPDALYAALSTVAVRLDACFREGSEEEDCRPQVRLVLQPVFDAPEGPTTRDAAVHVFYSSTTAQVLAAANTLAAARATHALAVPETIDGPHPGFASPAWVETVHRELGPLLRAERLKRVTSMSVHASNLAWIFSGADYEGGQPTPIAIPTLDEVHEGHVTSTGGTTAVEVTLDPRPTVESSLAAILKPGALASATATQRSEAAASLGRLEDPTFHNSGTVDCATCHVAALAQRALTSGGAIAGAPVPAPAVYDDTRNLRAFGYFFSSPSVSPRVQREIAFVRDDLARR